MQFKLYLRILFAMKLFVVRHGETDWNVKELACGVSESTLTEIPDARLHEIDFGDFEGKPWNNPEFLYIHKNPFLAFPSGESFAQTVHRAYSIIEDVTHRHTGGGNILFVCHGVLTAAIYTYFKSFSTEDLLRLEIKNCQLLEFDLGASKN